MRLISIMVATALAAPAGAQTKPAAAPLAPSGKWSIEYHEAMCVLSRDFGVGDDKVTLAFRPWTLANQVELVVVDGGSAPPTRDKRKAVVTVTPGGSPQAVDYFMVHEPNTKRRFTTLTIDREPLAAIGKAGAIAVTVRGTSLGNFALTGMPAAVVAVEKCETDLAKSWGVDSAEIDRVAVSAKAVGGGADWFSVNSYPPEALKNKQHGTTTILWTINPTGTVAGCRIVKSSGYAPLDQASCLGITQRGRFTPALDKEGKPIVSSQSRRIRWVLPE